LRCGQAARLEREAPAEIGPARELAGHVLTAITARSGCDHVVFRVDDGTFAVVHFTWTTRQEPDPWPATQRISSYIGPGNADQRPQPLIA
jgi:hypothetical protein